MTDAATEARSPDRIYLLDYGTDQVTWCSDPDPSGTGLHKPVEYVRASTPTLAKKAREVLRREVIEECAKVAEGTGRLVGMGDGDTYTVGTATQAATAIRALAQPGSGEVV